MSDQTSKKFEKIQLHKKTDRHTDNITWLNGVIDRPFLIFLINVIYYCWFRSWLTLSICYVSVRIVFVYLCLFYIQTWIVFSLFWIHIYEINVITNCFVWFFFLNRCLNLDAAVSLLARLKSASHVGKNSHFRWLNSTVVCAWGMAPQSLIVLSTCCMCSHTSDMIAYGQTKFVEHPDIVFLSVFRIHLYCSMYWRGGLWQAACV